MSQALLFSFLLPLLALAQSQLPPATYNGGDDNPPDPSDAGAAGAQKGAFNLSKGALAAIIVVAVIVVIGGSTSHISCTHGPSTNIVQLVQRHYGGSPRSDNGMSGNPLDVRRAGLLVVATRKTSRIVKIEGLAFVSTLLRLARTASHDRCTISRRAPQ
jgi:hypothetical protein